MRDHARLFFPLGRVRQLKPKYFIIQGLAHRLVSSAEPPRSFAEFFAALQSRESKQSHHTLQSREEAERHTGPAKHSMSEQVGVSFDLNNRRTSTSLKPSLADCAAAGAAVEAARLTAGTMV